MAKGQVIEHLGDGRYRVALKFGVERIQRELVELNERITELAVLVPQAKTELLQAEDAAKAKAAEIDAAIPDFQNGVDGAISVIRSLQRELVQLQAVTKKARLKADRLIAENLSLLKRRSQLERIPEEEIRDVWCADYVTDASGEVGLIEVNDEGRGTVIMQPAFNDEGGYLASRDGQLVPRAAQTGAQVYFNAAILPGVQKWRPRYRVGTLTAIDGGLANVTLDPATSSAQDLSINQVGILRKIPIQYMDCDATAFEVGDRVLVRWFESGPQVVGFESNPKPCFGHGIVFRPSQAQTNGDLSYWGEPFEDVNGDPINPPLGSSRGSNPIWSIQKRREASPIKKTRGLDYNYGLRNWIGLNSTRDILSWRGPASRVFDWYNAFGETSETRIPNFQTRWLRSSKVFYKLATLVDLTNYTLGGFTKVCGASLYYDGETPILLVVATSADEWSAGPEYRVYSWELTRQFEALGSPSQLQTFVVDPDIYPLTDWYFDASGKRAVCTLRNQKLQESDPVAYKRIYRAEYSLSGGFSITTVWDATALPQNRQQRFGQYRYRAIRREEGDPACGPTKLGISWDEKDNAISDTTRPFDSIPIYFDYRGLELVGAYFQKPETVSSQPTIRVKTKTTVDYPHPCAGQPRPGGGTYPANYRIESKQRIDIASGITFTASAKNQIVDSNGAVICEAKRQAEIEDLFTFVEDREFVDYNPACGSINIDELSYTMAYTGTNVNVQFGLLAIDLRTNFAATYEDNSVVQRSGSKSGVDVEQEAETDGSGSNFWHDLPINNAANFRERVMRIFLGNSLLEEVQVDYEDFLGSLPTTRRVDSDDWTFFPTNLFIDGCDDFAENDTVSTTILERDAAPNLVGSHTGDATCVQADELTAISASCFPSAPQIGEIGLYTYVSGVADPVAEIIERTEADRFVFHFLGVY